MFVSLSKLDFISGIIFCDKQKGILSIAFSVIERKKGCAELLITDHSFNKKKEGPYHLAGYITYSGKKLQSSKYAFLSTAQCAESIAKSIKAWH